MSLFDDEALTGTSDEDNVLVRSSQNEDFECQRPRKRRRIESSSDSQDEYDLPTTNQDDAEQTEKQARAKHLIHVPTFTGENENVFITQLDDLNSSPSRMRGPLWRKKTPDANSEPQRTRDAAGLSNLPHQVPQPQGIGEAGTIETFDGDSDDDLVFVEEIEVNHQRSRPTPPVRPGSTSFRQTTLFGTGPTQPSQSTQSRTHNWPLVNRNEAPTHHKLDYEALQTWIYPTNLGTIREYQFNITSRALYHNTLVALPTGLGKTFIAATVMLNFFRWTQDSQIIFVAPTKPLVAQQVDACFHIAGIPRSETTMLVGNVQPAIREQEWIKKRVFFMTPQTVENDLKRGICDPKKVALLVVDEAHRAKGEYAYVKVVKFLRRFNTSFRVLALTATPGSTVESVQEVIDGLDISRVEIRTEESLDIRNYVQMRNIEPVVLENSDEMDMILELFSQAVRPTMGKLASQNAYWNRDPLTITLFGLKKSRDEWMKTAGRRDQGSKNMVNAIFSILMKLANPLENLKYHSLAVFYRKMKAFEDETWNGKGTNARDIVSNEHWKKMMNRLQAWVNNADFEGHPKLTYLKEVVLNHFMDAGEGQAGATANTKIMVFSHYRDSAEEITRILNRHQPMIRAHVFVGQAASKNSEGMDQKKQQDIVNKFKQGTYNTLVATSIGEEGLDIGEVDLIICYDASKSPIRLLQRMGRTGRKRAGNIVLLLMKGKEERDYASANDNYLKMQQKIASGGDFSFHEDRSMRIVPKDVTPVVDKRIVEIPIENTQADWLPEPGKRGRKLKNPKKKFHMPDDVDTGFSFLGAGKKTQNKEHGQSRKPQPEIDSAPIPTLDSVCLSVAQSFELDERYMQIPGDANQIQYVQNPRLDAFPEKLRKLGPIGKVAHSRASKDLAKAIKAMHSTGRSWQRPLVAPSLPVLPLVADDRSEIDEIVYGDTDRFIDDRSVTSDRESVDLDGLEDGWNALLHAQSTRQPAAEATSVTQKLGRKDKDVDVDELPNLSQILAETRTSTTRIDLNDSPVLDQNRSRNRARRVLDDSDE